MHSRFIGGLLLIIGTSIGGGMLALPAGNAAAGFWSATLFLILCWFLMTTGAFFILEVNLYLPRGKNMVSMAYATLGVPGLVITWIAYLVLLYTLLCAYISGGADVLTGIVSHLNIKLIDWQSIVLFTVIFGHIVSGGIKRVDIFNRLLMFVKLFLYIILVTLISPWIHCDYWQHGDVRAITGSLMLLITSFGFAIIVPNLREYFDDNIPQLKRVILLGSLIPLLCYIAWDAVIMGTIISSGPEGLEAIAQNPHTTSALASQLNHAIHSQTISILFNTFTSVCMLTAFLGVSLCLASFLSDGLKISTTGRQSLSLYALTFIPPLLLVIYKPGAYMKALNYAGYFCIILLLLLPALMSFKGRKHYNSPFIVPGGRWTQSIVILGSLGLMFFSS